MLVLALVLALAWPATADTPDPVRIRGVTYLGDVPTLVADREGFFTRNGIPAEVRYGDSGKDNLARLRAGEADFALMALPPLVLDQLADPTPGEADDPVVLASLVHSTRLHQVVALADGPVQAPADLAGRRVGMLRGTSAEFAWFLFARYHGLDPAGAELVDLPVDAIPAALAAGAIDAAALWEPWTARVREHLEERLRTLPGSTAYTGKWVLVTRRSTATRETALCRAVLMAYRDAIDAIQRDPDAAMHLYAEHSGLDEAAVGRNWNAAVYALNLDWSLIANIQQQIDWALRAGYPAPGTLPGVLSLLAPEALRAVRPGAVGVPPAVEAMEGTQ